MRLPSAFPGSNKNLMKIQRVGGADHVINSDIISYSAAYRTKVWTMFKFIDTIYTYRRLYIIKETVDLE